MKNQIPSLLKWQQTWPTNMVTFSTQAEAVVSESSPLQYPMARPRSSIRGVDQLEEQIQYERFLSRLSAAARHEDSEREKSRITAAPGNSARDPTTTPNHSKPKKSLSMDHLQRLTDIAFLTNLAHKHSRISSMCGEGFYTIGPCGEELLAAVALALRSSDPSPLSTRLCQQ